MPRPRLPRGFLVPGLGTNQGPEKAKGPLAKTEIQVAKNNQSLSLCAVWGWSTFPATSTGKPDDGSDRRETARKATGSQRETGGGRSRTGSQRETGGGRPRTESDRETGNGTSTRSRWETAGIGGRETEGDPSGSSAVNRPASRKVCHPNLGNGEGSRPRKRGRERGLRTAQPLASANGDLPSGVRSPAGQNTGRGAPRGLKLRPRLPRGFLAFTLPTWHIRKDCSATARS